MKKVDFLKISEDIKLEINNEIEKLLNDELNELLSELKYLHKLNLDKLTPMHYMDEDYLDINELRDDLPVHNNIKGKILDNANNHDNDYVHIKRVVK